jgi:RNA recognition motif-containing protein
MSNRVFVGNLPAGATEEGLRRLFIEHGYPVREIDLIQESGQPQGVAFVNLAPYADRHHAVNDINGNYFLGRRLIVNEWPLDHHAASDIPRAS